MRVGASSIDAPSTYSTLPEPYGIRQGHGRFPKQTNDGTPVVATDALACFSPIQFSASWSQNGFDSSRVLTGSSKIQ